VKAGAGPQKSVPICGKKSGGWLSTSCFFIKIMPLFLAQFLNLKSSLLGCGNRPP
jgi:hypothetical protein